MRARVGRGNGRSGHEAHADHRVHQDPEFIPRLIPLLTEMPLAEVLSQHFVAACWSRCLSAIYNRWN